MPSNDSMIITFMTTKATLIKVCCSREKNVMDVFYISSWYDSGSL